MARASKKNKVYTTKSAEERYVGSEITNWKNIEDISSAIKQNLKHYHYFYDNKFASKWTLKYIQKYKTNKEVREFNSAEIWRNNITIGGLCKMVLDGAILDESKKKWLEENIEKEILLYGRSNLTNKKNNSNVIKITQKSPAEIVKDRISDFIGNLENLVDNWKENLDYNLYEELKKMNAPYLMAKSINDYYRPLQEELIELINSDDSQLKEAYGFRSNSENKSMKKFIDLLMNDSEKYMNSKKATRKPRKKKVKSAHSQISKIRYQKESPEFKLTSMNPEKIIGASVILLFNTKYKTLTYLVSCSSKGFSVKGTTIQDIDVENSFKKTLRKAEDKVLEFSSATKTRVLKLMNDLKTTKNEANGRLSEDVIIMRIF